MLEEQILASDEYRQYLEAVKLTVPVDPMQIARALQRFCEGLGAIRNVVQITRDRRDYPDLEKMLAGCRPTAGKKISDLLITRAVREKLSLEALAPVALTGRQTLYLRQANIHKTVTEKSTALAKHYQVTDDFWQRPTRDPLWCAAALNSANAERPAPMLDRRDAGTIFELMELIGGELIPTQEKKEAKVYLPDIVDMIRDYKGTYQPWVWASWNVVDFARDYFGALECLFDIHRKAVAVEALPWLQPLFDAAIHGAGSLCWTPETLYWVPRPEIRVREIEVPSWAQLRGDANEQVHCADGPAVINPIEDLYVLQGFVVEKYVVLEPTKISCEEIAAERNAEMRRILMEQLGMSNFIAKASAEQVDVDVDEHNGTRALFRTNVGRQQGWLVCACPTTARTYFMEVPPETKTCVEANTYLDGPALVGTRLRGAT